MFHMKGKGQDLYETNSLEANGMSPLYKLTRAGV
jgi:hypothetical protein